MKTVYFVFGSNLAGRHGRGAAKKAHQHWGAAYGTGKGFTGNAYAVPTKDKDLKPLPLKDIRQHVKDLIHDARTTPRALFYITAFGTGLAGYSIKEIKSLFGDFSNLPYNMVFTKDWID